MVPPPCPGAAGRAGLGAHPAAGAPRADQHPQSLSWLRVPRRCLPGPGSFPFPRDGASPLRLSHAVGAAAQPPSSTAPVGELGPCAEGRSAPRGRGADRRALPGHRVNPVRQGFGPGVATGPQAGAERCLLAPRALT